MTSIATPEAVELARRIARLGVELKPDREAGRVLYRPADRLPDELAALLAVNKWAVMNYLDSRTPVDAVLDSLPERDRLDLHERYLARAESNPDAAWRELGEELERRLARLDELCGEEPGPPAAESTDDWAAPTGRLLATCPDTALRDELADYYATAAARLEREQGVPRHIAERDAFGLLLTELLGRSLATAIGQQGRAA